MTETASRPGTTPAVATLTAPDTEGTPLTDETATPPDVVVARFRPESNPPEGEVVPGNEVMTPCST